MMEIWWTILLIAAVVVVLKWFGSSELEKALKIARATGSVTAVIAAVETAPEGRHPTLWDQAIGTLWREYRREEAFEVMIAAAQRSEASIVQYWLKNAMEVEPEMAAEKFDEEFLMKYFKPSVAASCGRCGCR